MNGCARDTSGVAIGQRQGHDVSVGSLADGRNAGRDFGRTEGVFPKLMKMMAAQSAFVI